MTPTTVLAFHAEKLHDEEVWRRVKKIAVWMAQQGWYATFFVDPFRAQVAGRDIADRVQTLATLKHEIGQHTHLYAGTRIDMPDKMDDLSKVNILHCLRRDFATLCQIGVTPQGFTAGAWLVESTLPDRLIELGFVYDCSARLPTPTGISQSPYHRWLSSPQYHANATGRLLCLPTTCSLGEWFKWRYKRENVAPYQLVYLHDYDLLSLRNYVRLYTFLAMLKKSCVIAGKTLAEKGLQEEYKEHV